MQNAFASRLSTRAYAPIISDGTTPLAAALDAVSERRWAGRRCRVTNVCQARQAIRSLKDLIAPDAEEEAPSRLPGGSLPVAAITQDHVRELVRRWSGEGLSPSAINVRVGFFAALGVDTSGCRVRVRRDSKWWLNAEAQAKLIAALTASGDPTDALMADYIVFTTNAGFRVEENLRLERRHFAVEGGRVLVTVPGTKTSGAEATLPLNDAAGAVYLRRLQGTDNPHARLFPITYQHLGRMWRECRMLIGARGNKMATLKALRRSAARNLTTGGMPLPMLQFYLRHEGVRTTEGYLRLTGGFHASELARWL